jgi:hypothetical protein
MMVLGTSFHDHNTLSSFMFEDMPFEQWCALRFFSNAEVLQHRDATTGDLSATAGGRCYHDLRIRNSNFTIGWQTFWKKVYSFVSTELCQFFTFILDADTTSDAHAALFSFLFLSDHVQGLYELDTGRVGERRSQSSGTVDAAVTSLSPLQLNLVLAFLCEGITRTWDQNFSFNRSNAALTSLSKAWSGFHWFVFRSGLWTTRANVTTKTPAFVWYWPLLDEEDEEKEVTDTSTRTNPMTLLVLPTFRTRGATTVEAALLVEDSRGVVSESYQGARVGGRQHVHWSMSAIKEDARRIESLNQQQRVTPTENEVNRQVRTSIYLDIGLSLFLSHTLIHTHTHTHTRSFRTHSGVQQLWMEKHHPAS